MRPDDLTPPAIVAPAEGLGELAAVANAGYEAGEDATRKGIDHDIAAGEALVKAKKLCGHGKWSRGWRRASASATGKPGSHAPLPDATASNRNPIPI